MDPMPMRGSMLVVSSGIATTSSASGSVAGWPRAEAVTPRTTQIVTTAASGLIERPLPGCRSQHRLLEQLDGATRVVGQCEHLVELDLRLHAIALDDRVAPGSAVEGPRVVERLPLVDAAGHWLEPMPIFLDYLKQVGGPSLVEHFKSKDVERGWYAMTREERLDQRPFRPTWWGEPGNTLDRATAMVPKLFYERLDDFGVDFCLLYTSLGLFHINNADAQIRRGVSRAVNMMNAEMFAPYRHRIAPAAVVPVYTPEEAIEEATYAVRELGFKVIMISNHVKRPIPALARAVSDPTTVRYFIDSPAHESPQDYDRFWQACLDLKVAVTAHSGSMGWHGRESINNFSLNHIGHFAAASHAFARALIFGGVVKRFPRLRFGLLEGGVGWACNLSTDLIAH